MNAHLKIQTADPDRIHLVQITDTHIMADPEERFDGVDTAATLSAVLDRIEGLETKPDAILATGDLVHEPESRAYERLSAGNGARYAASPVIMMNPG